MISFFSTKYKQNWQHINIKNTKKYLKTYTVPSWTLFPVGSSRSDNKEKTKNRQYSVSNNAWSEWLNKTKMKTINLLNVINLLCMKLLHLWKRLADICFYLKRSCPKQAFL